MLFMLLNYFPATSQEIIDTALPNNNLAIQQIELPTYDDLQTLQTLNQNIGNTVSTTQQGDENIIYITQQNNNITAHGNKSEIYQTGDLNKLNADQEGGGNVLLGFQLGVSNGADNNNFSSPTSPLTPDLPAGNSLNIVQNGINNGIIAIQEGTNNSLSAEQSGSNNYMYALQEGANNSVIGYKQDNESDQMLYDKIIQIGDNLSLRINNAFNSNKNGDTFVQTGTNLSFQLNNNQNTFTGGVEVNMRGNNMKVIVDQSFVLIPMK